QIAENAATEVAPQVVTWGAFKAINFAAALPAIRLPQGGTYKLVAESGAVVRTGRTINLARRSTEQYRKYGDLRFEVDRLTNNPFARRGREQIIHDMYQPIL